MTQYPKVRSVGFFLLFFFAMTLTGCACRDRYEPALSQWQENLERLRPTMEKGAAMLPDDLGETKMGLYDRTIQGIQRVRGEGPEVWSQEAEGVETPEGGDQ